MYKLLRRLLAVFILLLSAVAAAPVAARDSLSPEAIEDLAPGEFVWEPERADGGPVEIVIGLQEQRAWIFRSGTLIGASTVSSGREGHTSPYGRFQILEKRRTHRSNRYDDAPMPYMQRLNWHGVALHGGNVPGYPASHGCIRLPMKFAKALFAVTEVGSGVYVSWEPVASPDAALEFAALQADQPMPPDRLPREEAKILGTR